MKTFRDFGKIISAIAGQEAYLCVAWFEMDVVFTTNARYVNPTIDSVCLIN